MEMKFFLFFLLCSSCIDPVLRTMSLWAIQPMNGVSRRHVLLINIPEQPTYALTSSTRTYYRCIQIRVDTKRVQEMITIPKEQKKRLSDYIMTYCRNDYLSLEFIFGSFFWLPLLFNLTQTFFSKTTLKVSGYDLRLVQKIFK